MIETCILQVEDDDNDIVLLREVFQEAGITSPVQVVTDGQQAIDYLAGAGPYADRAKYPLPGVVLLDLKLPSKPGLAVLEWMRARRAFDTTVVIVLSFSSDPGDIEQAYRLGANSYVVKPVQLDQQLEIARLLKAWWLGYNQLIPAGEDFDSSASSSAPKNGQPEQRARLRMQPSRWSRR